MVGSFLLSSPSELGTACLRGDGGMVNLLAGTGVLTRQMVVLST